MHRGPLPQFLDPLMMKAILYGIDNVDVQTCHISDEEYRKGVQKVSPH